MTLSQLVPNLRKIGSELHGPCPFCGEGDDRFIVWPDEGREERGRFLCRQCDAKGDAIDFVRETEGVGYVEACERLGIGTGTATPAAVPMPRKQSKPPLLIEQVRAANQRLLSAADPAAASALRYLSEVRGLDVDTTIRPCLLGIAPFPRHSVGGDGILVPLSSEGEGVTKYKSFAFDPDACDWRRNAKGKKILYTHNGSTLYLAREARRSEKPIVLCEGELCALTARQYGYNAITGTAGAKTFADEWADEIAAMPGARQGVFVAYDADATGRDGREIVAQKLRDRGLDAYLVDLPEGRDVNDVLRVEGGMAVFDRCLAPSATKPAEDGDAPAIPQRVYELIPQQWREACGLFDRWHERDVFLTGIIGTLSSVLSLVRFQYGKTYHSPHLFFFVIAAAASGKGVLEHAFRWIDKVDEHLIETSAEKRREWQEEKAAYDRSQRGKNETPLPDPGPPPPERFLRASEDSTLPEMYDGLRDNQPEGLFLASTEADALSNANSREWGGFTHLLRRAFHHESARKATKSDGRIRLKDLRMAVVLSGTPDQYGRLAESIEDGTYSRFAALRFEAPLEYVSQRPTANDLGFETFTEERANDAFKLWSALQCRRETVERDGEMFERPRPLYFDVSPELWERIDAPFRALFDRLFKEQHAPVLLTANIKRGALIAFRIAAVIAVWRAFERGEAMSVIDRIEATEADIEAGCALGLVYCEHAIRQAFAELAKRGDGELMPDTADVGGLHRMSGRMRQFLDALPDSFTSEDAEHAGDAIGVSRATTYRYLARLQEQGHAAKLEHGQYAKRPEEKPAETTRLCDFERTDAGNGESLNDGKTRSLNSESGMRLPESETICPDGIKNRESLKVSQSRPISSEVFEWIPSEEEAPF